MEKGSTIRVRLTAAAAIGLAAGICKIASAMATDFDEKNFKLECQVRNGQPVESITSN
jgi:hypothetical protein